MLSKVFRSQKKEVKRRWRELHKQELRYLYYSPNVITGITSRMMKKGGGHVARIWKKRKTFRALVGKTDRQDLEDLGVEERIF